MPAMKLPTLTLLALAGVFSACSTQTLYATGQEWQKQECRKLPDMAERARCEKSAATSYERYKAEAEAAKKPRE
jgi:hypothetical protein